MDAQTYGSSKRNEKLRNEGTGTSDVDSKLAADRGEPTEDKHKTQEGMDQDGDGRVDLSGIDGEEDDLVGSQSSVSLGTKVNNIQNGRPVNTSKMAVVTDADGVIDQRYSDRLAS
jgi:hypothetical protein